MPSLHARGSDRSFLRDHPATNGSSKIDTSEADKVIGSIARTFAELTSRQDGAIRQHLIEELMREIMHYDAEFRRADAAGEIGSGARH